MRPALACALLVSLTLPALAEAQDPEVVAQGEGRIVVLLARLGDANGDGRDDLLRIDTRLSEEDLPSQSTARAISGAGLKEVLWTHVAPEGASLMAWQDADGDGVLEVLESEGQSSMQDSSLPIPPQVADQSSRGQTSAQDVRIRSGRDAHELATLHLDSAFAFDDLYAGEAWLTGSTINSTALNVAAPSLLVEAFTSRVRETYSVFAPAGVVSLNRVDVDARLRFHALGGAMKQVDVVASDRLASAPALADVDGDGKLDAVLLDTLVRQAIDAGMVQTDLYEPSVVAYGSDGSLAWRADFPQMQGDVFAPLLVGDVDGDGGDDVAFTVRTSTPLTGSAYTLRVLVGADGAVLASAGTPLPLNARPFGDIDGDGKEEMLVQDFSGDVPQAFAAGADLRPRWSVALDDTVILNNDGPGRRMTDLTGDGRPDLAYAREFDGGQSSRTTCTDGDCVTEREFDPFQFKLDVLGSDGKPVWTKELSNLLSYNDVPDLDGRGGVDIAVLHLEGDAETIKKGDLRGANVTLEVFAGEDGATLLRHELRGEDKPLTRDSVPSVSLVALGDLDGRGGSELGIGLRERSSDFDVAATEAVVQDWIVFSTTAGRPIAQLAAPQPSDDDDPAAQQGPGGVIEEAPDLDPVAPKDTPLAAPVAMLAVLSALGVLLRRRK